MAQFNWTYLGDNGQRFNVGVFHGSKTGHVLVFCNLKVVLIDFSVLDTKEYSLFLGDELCQLKLDKRGDRFFYDMTVDRDADTPLNRHRKARDKKHWQQSIAFFSAMLLCIITFTSVVIYNHNPEEQVRMEYQAGYLAGNAQKTTGIITKLAENQVYYQYQVDNQLLGSYINNLQQSTLRNHMPIEPGDEFTIIYKVEDPREHHINLDNPTEMQMERYFHRIFDKHSDNYSEFSSEQVECMVATGYQLKGLEAFADFYFQHLSPDSNILHNNHTYKRLVRDIPFKNLMEQQCY